MTNKGEVIYYSFPANLWTIAGFTLNDGTKVININYNPKGVNENG